MSALPPTGDAERRASVQVIARAADVLRALQGEPDGLSLAQISRQVGLARSTIHRLVVALTEEGFVVPASPNGRVRLGPLLNQLAASSGSDLRRDLRPHMERLSADVGDTVDLAVLEGGLVRFVEQVPGPHRLRAVSAPGDLFPTYCTANGKALLAAISDAEVDRLLPARLRPLTPNTITTRSALRAEIDTVRVAGFAFDREEHALGVSAVGATVSDASGSIAALTIVAPEDRFARNEKTFVDALLETCAEASRMLGGNHS